MIEALKHAEFSDKKQWWLGVRPGDLPERVILTLLIDIKPNVFARQMEDWTHLAGDTEYQAYRGSYKGMDVGVVYAGSGAYSVTTAIDELARLGIKVMVRYANSGGLSDEVNVGDYYSRQRRVGATSSLKARAILLRLPGWCSFPARRLCCCRSLSISLVTPCATPSIPA